jgi:exopolysaccharide biosynthesis protein
VVNGAEKELPFGSVYSTHVTSFVKAKDCLAGINTNPFDKVSAKEGEERKIAGLSVSDGVMVSPIDPAFDAIVFYRDGGAAIVRQAEIADLQNIENAAGGFGMVLEEGRIPERLTESRRHPRSAAGLSGGGKTLYLLVVDGRRPGSAGATEAELGLLLKQLGAEWGLNFDGGGSSVLALRFPSGEVRAVNTPIHNYIPGWERGVAACLGLGSNLLEK